MNKIFTFLGLSISILMMSPEGKAAVFTWNGGTGNWNTPASWVITGGPTTSMWPGENAFNADSVVINSSGTISINVNLVNSSVRQVRILAGTLTTDATNRNVVINEDLMIGVGATFNIRRASLTVTGPTDIVGTLDDNDNVGSSIFGGLVQVANSGILLTANNSTWEFRNGIFGEAAAVVNLQGTGNKNFTVNNQNINLPNANKVNSLTQVRISPLRIASGVTLTNQGFLQVDNITGIAAGANFINDTNSTLYTINTNPFVDPNVGFSFAAVGNTVNYNSNSINQSISIAGFHHLSISNYANTIESTKTLNRSVVVNGKLTVESNCAVATVRRSTLQLAQHNLTVSDSTIVLCQSSINDNNGTGSTSLQHILIDGTGSLFSYNQGSNININQSLTLRNSATLTDISATGNNNQITGPVMVSSGTTFGLDLNVITFSGKVIVEGTFRDNSASGAAIFSDSIIVNNGGNFNFNLGSNLALNGPVTVRNGGLIQDDNATGSTNSISGILRIETGGTFGIDQNTITISGKTNVSGTLRDNSTTGSASFQDSVKVFDGGVFNYFLGSNISITGVTQILNGGLVRDSDNNGISNFIGKTIILPGGTFDIERNTIIFTDSVLVAGSLLNSQAIGSIQFNASLNVLPGGAFNSTVSQAMNFRNGINYNGEQFASGAGLFTFGTNSQAVRGKFFTISGGLTATSKLEIFDSLQVNGIVNVTMSDSIKNFGTVILTNTSAPSLNGSAAASRWFQASGSTLIFNGSSMFTTGQLAATSTNNIVNYARTDGDQTVFGTTYRNLWATNVGNTGNRIKTLSNATTVNGKLIVSGNCINNRFCTFQLSTFNFTSNDSTIVNCNGIFADNSVTGNAALQIVKINSGGLLNYNQGSNIAVNNKLIVGNNGIVRDDNANGTTISIAKTTIETGGTFDLEFSQIAFNDTVLVAGTMNNSNVAGSILFNGNLRIQPGGAFNSTTNESMTFRRGIHFNGNTFNSGTGTFTFNTNTQAISGKYFTISGPVTATSKLIINDSLQINGLVNINMADSVINNGTAFLTNVGANSLNANNVAGRWHQGLNSKLFFAGQTMFGTNGQLSALRSGNQVHFDAAGIQTIPGYGYSNLIASGSGIKTLANNGSIEENLSIQGGSATLDLQTFTLNRTVSGGNLLAENGNTITVRDANNFPKNFSSANLDINSTVIYNRNTNADQQIEGVTYGNLVFANNNIAATKTANGNIVVNNTLTLNGSTGGRFILNGFNLAFGSVGSYIGTINNNTFIDLSNGGTVNKFQNSPTTFQYPVGFNGVSLPATTIVSAATFSGQSESRFIQLGATNRAETNQVDTTYSLKQFYTLTTGNISQVSGSFRFTYQNSRLPVVVTPAIEQAYATGFWNGNSYNFNLPANVDEVADTAFYAFTSETNISGNYTAALPNSFLSQRFFSRSTGNWEDAATWSLTSHVGAAYVVSPTLSSRVLVGSNHNVTISTAAPVSVDTLNLYTGGRLNVGTFNSVAITTFLNSSGSGTLATQGLDGDTARFPTITGFNGFSTSLNRVIEYTGATNYFIPNSLAAYRGLVVSGTGIKRLTRNITVTNTTLLTSTILFMEQYSISASGAIFTMGTNATLRIGNPALATAVIFPNGFGTNSINASSTVIYASNGNQNVRNLTYGNLNLATTGTKTLLGNTNIAGNLDVAAGTTLNYGATLRSIVLSGNLSGAGTINMSSANHELYLRGANNNIGQLITSANNSLIAYDRTGDQQVFASPNYRLLRTAGSGNKTVDGIALIAGQTSIRATSSLQISTNNYKINLGATTIDATAAMRATGQHIKVTTGTLTANGNFTFDPNFTTASSADTIEINGNLTIGSAATSKFTISNFAGAQRATGTMRINISGDVSNSDTISIADNTQILLSGNWLNNRNVAWNAFETRYPKVYFVKSNGTQQVQNGLSFNNFPEVEIVLGPAAKVELLRDMRVGSHFTLTSGTFICGQEVGGSQGVLVTGDWRSNGGAFNSKSSTIFFEGAQPTLIGTTAGTPHHSGTDFYNLSITKSGVGANRIAQNSNSNAITVRTKNNFSILSGTYRMRDRVGSPSDTDLVVKGNIFTANNACLDLTGGSPTNPALHAEAANIHLYLSGDLIDQNLDANLFGNNSNGLFIGTINGDNQISNKPTVHFCGQSTIQSVTGFTANSGSRGGTFSGITLPNVEIDGTNTTLVMGSALRNRGFTRVRKTNKLIAAGQAYGFYGLLLNDGAVATSPPFNYFLALRVDSGAIFEAEPGASIYIHPRSKIFADTNSTLSLVGTFTDPVSFIRDGLASGERHSHEYHGNISARFVRYQIGDAGGNSNITTSVCGGSRSSNVYIGHKASLSAFPNNFSNSDFASVGATIGLWIDAPLTIGVNDTLVGINFGGNPTTYSCSRSLGLAVSVILKNSGGVRGGAIFGPSAECDSTGPANTRAITGRVRWSSSSTLRWTGDQNTNWFNVNNWVPTQIPSRLDIIELPTGRYRYPTLNNNATAGRMNIGLLPTPDPLVAPIGTIEAPGINLSSFTLDMVGDSLSLFGDMEVASIIGGGTNAFLNLGSGRLRLQGNLLFTQNVNLNFNDTVTALRPGTGTIEFYSGKNAMITMAAQNNDSPGLLRLYNLEINKETGALSYSCANKMLVHNLTLNSGSFRHGTCSDGSPLFLTGSMNITPGAFHDNRGEIVQFISRNKAPRTIKTGGNVYRRFYIQGGVGARYMMQDSLAVNTAANASLQIHSQDTLATNGNTIIARNLEVSNANGPSAMLRVDANGTLLMNTGGTVNVSPTAIVELIGGVSGFASSNCLTNNGTYAFSVNGTIRAKNYIIERTNADGLNIANGIIDNTYPDNLSFGIFDNGSQRASNNAAGPARYITFNTTAMTGINYLIKDVAFANSSNRTAYMASNAASGTNTLANAAAGNLAGTGTNRYTFENPSGSLGSVTASENEYDNPAFGQSTGFVRWIKNGIRWNGSTNNSWHVAGNWSSGTVPTANDNVVLSHRDRPNAYTVNITAGPAICRSLLIINSNEGTGSALGTITLNVSGNNLDVKKEISLASGIASVLNLSANRNLFVGTSFFNSGTFNSANNSTLTFYGDGQRQLGVNDVFNLAIVDSTGANTYTLNNNTIVRGSLTIGSQSTLDVTSSNYALSLRSHVNPFGQFRPRGGTVTFEGTNPQRVNGNITFNRFYLDKSSENVYVPKHKLRINELAFLIQGNIRTSWIFYPVDPIAADTMGEVEIGPNGDIAQASSNSFVDGRLTIFYKNSALPVLKNFHIGKQNANGYTQIPLRVRLTSPSPTRIRGEVFTFFSGATVPFTSLGNYSNCDSVYTGWGHNIDHLSGIRYWQFDKLDSTLVDSARITLPWNANDLVFVPADLAIFKGDGTCLDMLNNNYFESTGTPIAGTISSSVNFTTFSPFIFGTTLPSDINPLPLDLISFTGNYNKTNKSNDLLWTTVNEKDVSHFEVEASADGKTFETIGRVEAKNNQRGTAGYRFEDKKSQTNMYYRLKMVDQNADFKRSTVVYVQVAGRLAAQEVMVYPNPATDLLHIKLTGSGTLSVREITGRQVFSREMSEEEANKIDISNWSKGIYIVEWTNENQKSLSKFIKE